ncbi:MAG TPA: hypothetical protein VFJ57_16230 [Solirubrobacterales bacterium]|nr:hypothetical protein [Solirubrobacterales bacterium]
MSLVRPARRWWIGAVLAAAIALALAPRAAQGTFAGENGRIFYVAGAFTASSTVMSACPANGGHVKTVMPLATVPYPSPDGTKVAYVKLKANGNLDGIWVADADGSNPDQITTGLYSDFGPSWSPDGTKLTFRRFVEYPGTGSVMQPVVANVATKVVTPLLSVDNIATAPEQTTANAWTADGSQIYFPADGGHGEDLYRVAAAGGTATRILGDDNTLPSFSWIDIAPGNGSMMVQQLTTFNPEALNETWRYDLSGGGGVKLAENFPEKGTGDEALSYSPDGTKIIFNRLVSEEIMSANLNGSSATQVGGLVGAFPRWSTNTDDCTDPGAATMKVNEVGLGAARFVELLDSADETFPSGEGPYKVVVYDAAGARQDAHPISSSLLQGRDNTKPLLLSTAAADTAYGVSGDEALSIALPNPGQACFTQGAGESKVNCVSWGCVTNAVSASSTRIPVPGAGQSVQRQGIGSSTFQLAAPTPKAANVAGSGGQPCPVPVGGGGGESPPTPATPVTVPPSPAPTVLQAKPKPLKCKKGFKKTTVKGKAKCVKAKKKKGRK